MYPTFVALLVVLLSACSPVDSAVESNPAATSRSPYDDPNAPEWSELDRASKIEMAQALSAFPDVKVAYLLKRFDPDGTCHFALDIVFDGEANTAALDAATKAFASVAPPEKKLEILLFTPEAQAQVVKQANATPFYMRK